MTSRVTVRAAGRAAPDEVWDRFARPRRWPEWAPQVQRVEADVDVIVAGAAGRVHGPGRAFASFIVVDVDHGSRSWSWRVRVGSLRLLIDHAVTTSRDGRTVAHVVLHGPWLVVRCGSLLARLALQRLVRR